MCLQTGGVSMTGEMNLASTNRRTRMLGFLIAIAALVVAISFEIYTNLAAPVYRAKACVRIHPSSEGFGTIISEVAEREKGNLTVQQFRSTELFYVAATGRSASAAAKLADEGAQRILEMLRRYPDDESELDQNAQVPDAAIYPNRLLNRRLSAWTGGLGIVAGLSCLLIAPSIGRK